MNVEPQEPAASQAAIKLGGGASFRRLAPVRLAIFVCCLLAGDIAAQISRVWVLRHVPRGVTDFVALPLAIALCAMLIGLYVLLVRSLERRKAAEARPNAVWAATGVVLGFGLFSSVLALLWLIGNVRWRGPSAHFDLIPAIAAAMLAAVGEELALRGGAFRILEDTFGTTIALVLSAALFGLLHAANPGATVVSTVAIALEAGVLLAAAYALTRNLWLPIGIHFGWNFTESGVFGAVGSGFGGRNGAFSATFSGPTLLTGGTFGPEASVVAVAVTLIAAAVLIIMTTRRGLWIPARARLWLD